MRLIVGVDQVVGHAGMIGLGGEKFFQNRRGLLAIGEGGIVVRFGGQQRERVENCGFVIVGISFVNLFHRIGVGLGAGIVIQFFGVAVKRGDGSDVGLLARSCGAVSSFRQMNFFDAVLNYFRVGIVPKLVPQAHGYAPVRHGAVRGVGGNMPEFLSGFFVPERVQQSHAALEGLLHIRRAGNREADRAELRRSQLFVVMVIFIVVGNGRTDGREDEQR